MAMTAEILFFLFTFAVLVQAQKSGFISIDCGIPEGSNYTDEETGIFYTSDAGFVHSGENREYPPSNDLVASSFKRQYRTMRSFPEGERNCYTVRPVQKGRRYFMRASFAYVHHTERMKLQGAPEFDVYVGINLWTTVSLRNASDPWWTEIVVVAPWDFVPVCLVNTGKGAPFISALEARLVKDSMYEEASYNQSLRAMWLLDAGSTTQKIIRYPEDEYDRLWVPYTAPSWASIATSLTVSNPSEGYEPPSAVMQTAATPLDANASLYYNWSANDPSTEFHVFRHISDFKKPNGNATLREINCCQDGLDSDSCYVLVTEYLLTHTIRTTGPLTSVRKHSISLSKTEKSVLPPILNALEIYVVLSLNQTATDEQEVHAMMTVKDVFGLRKNWMGDPCLPNKYLWEGVTCSYDWEKPPRIISLNLSSFGLTGEIDESFGNLNQINHLDLSKNNLRGPIPSFLSKLPSLAYLDLSDNNLKGTVPEFLATLILLTYLNLSQNQFSGSVPMSLVDKSRTGSLKLSVDPNLCNSTSCNSTDPCALKPCKKRRSINQVVVTVAVTAVAVTAVTMGIAGFIWVKCRKSSAAARPNINSRSTVNRESGPFFNIETRRFSYDEIVSMTNDFERPLGRGAFGNVYYGQMKNGNEVAVKMLTQNVQASMEFQTEVQLLMTLYHRHLVPFVGYCADGEYRALILEYMARGNLENLLSVQDHEKEILSWDQRVHIALDVAQGLEYLHVFCKPPIIHRDVKAANILLNENLEAKLADFGICKVFTDDHYSHITTQVRGTHGYLDPEYFHSNNLNEKSDVYGYGVVLLQLITGKPAITQITRDDDSDIYKISLVEWMSPFVSAGDIRSIVDPKLQSDYNVGFAWRVLDLAISCTQPKSVRRPSISSVVVQLKECFQANDYFTDGRTDEFETRSHSSFLCSPR